MTWCSTRGFKWKYIDFHCIEIWIATLTRATGVLNLKDVHRPVQEEKCKYLFPSA